MRKYISGVSAVVVMILIFIAVAALVIGNKYYQHDAADETPEQAISEQQREQIGEEAPHQQQRESAMSPKQSDELKQSLASKAILDLKSDFPDMDNAKISIDNIQLGVHFGGSKQDVVCGNINAKSESKGHAGITRFVWNSNEPIEIESDDNKARFQLAWSLFCQ